MARSNAEFREVGHTWIQYEVHYKDGTDYTRQVRVCMSLGSAQAWIKGNRPLIYNVEIVTVVCTVVKRRNLS